MSSIQLSSNRNPNTTTTTTIDEQTSNTTSILIPGYLLVKCNDNNDNNANNLVTYELQQTVMAINMDANIQLSTILNDNNNNLSAIKLATIPQSSMTSSVTSDCVNHLQYSTVKTVDNKHQNNNENNRDIEHTFSKNAVKKCEKNVSLNLFSVSSSRGLARVSCPVCNREFKKTYLKEHLLMHEQHKPYKCVICGVTYRWRTLLRNHAKTHLAENPFTCPVCKLRMSSKFSVQQHILKVHENAEKKYSCDKCSKCYVTTHQLKAHQKFHSEDRTRQCEYCGRIYKHIASLEKHRRAHNNEENSLDLRLKCFVCGLICHSKTHFTAHQRIHTGEKPFVCEICGKCYRQIAQLNQHKIVHTDLRPFSCTLCERTFRCKSNLQLHIDHHSGEKRHSCADCGQRFFSYPNMLKHIRRNHLGLRPFKCDLCDNKRFCEKQELQNHMRTHTGEKRPLPKSKRLPLPSLPSLPDIVQNDTIILKVKSRSNKKAHHSIPSAQ